ncbi:hypothetical protein MZK49_23970 [Ensifer sesbaniae]|uniref:hypothetical protein n=1 Tax=Ensifer sesbaniae TaxID=1214071 RepID=UPI001FEABB47|nr:hypothetical protein [Ensifer sesbaniae]MCK3779755.1 hypothetical protein [Ensifer sesbaniae]NRQ15210.1 hypothetical protein [Ensifer sesbaniae]
MVAFLRDYVRILAYHLSVGPFPRLSKIIAAIGLAVSGPGVLYTVIEAIIAGEVRNRGAVIATAKEEPFKFYTMTLIVGSGAAFVTALGVAAFLVLILKGRRSRSE